MAEDDVAAAGGIELAAFGRLAATHIDLDELLGDVCLRAVEGLGVSHAKLLEYRPAERDLLVRAGVGWAPDVVGVATLGADLGSPAGFALQTGEPTIANDLDAEARFRVPDLLREHGIRSAVNVIVRFGDVVYGVLEADSRSAREFDDRDARFLQGFADVVALAIAQHEAHARQTQLARQLDVALHELQHRTRNNNQMLLSIIRLTQRRHRMLETRQALDEFAGRIDALIRVDQAILGASDPATIDLGRYAVGIIQNLIAAGHEDSAEISLETQVSDVAIEGRRAQALGLIVNEFVTNSFKHAFASDRTNALGIAVAREGDEIRLTLWDNGPGFDRGEAAGLGTTLIDAMAQSLNGACTWTTGPDGTKLQVSFRHPGAEVQPPDPSSVAAP